MLVIGESIHVISARVRAALETRDRRTLQELAVRQVEGGAHALDLNIGPQKKEGAELLPWLVDAVQEVVDVQLCLDTTNVAALEAGLPRCKRQAIINSTDATDERMAAMMPLAKKYNARLIALALAESGLPATAEDRLDLVLTRILPAAEKYGLPVGNLYLDPLVLTVNGMQEQAQQTVSAVHYFKQVADPPPETTCGASNVSNGVPRENRPLINPVFVAMMMGAGISSAIVSALDEELMRIVKVVSSGVASSKKDQLYLDLAKAAGVGEEFQVAPELLSDPETRDVAKTINILYNRQIYAPSYLTL
ncbi:MAG: dihydropteroate synthase [Chloroflexota bacterium]|nr:dihydropteroate synthase [Chloroflexota bacterium]